jgi:hypothetical protein
MSKRMATWGWPAVSFLVAGLLAVLAGPTMGAMGRLRALQGSTDWSG